MLPRGFLPLSALLVGLLFLTSCGESGDALEFSSELTEDELKLGDVLKDGDSAGPEFSDEDRTKALAAARERDASTIHFFASGLGQPFNSVQARLFDSFLKQRGGPPVRTYDSQDVARHQLAELEAAIEAGALGIVLCPVETEILRDAVKLAIDKSIPVLILGASADQLKGTANLPIDHRSIGEMAANFVVERLKVRAEMQGDTELKGRIIELTGTEDLTTAAGRLRSEGFWSVVDQNPGVRVVHQAPGLWKPLPGGARVLEAIEIQEDTDVIFAHNDAMAYGAYIALRNRGKESAFLIVGVDGVGGPEGGISKVREQMLAATIAVPTLAREAADVILALVEGNSVPTPSLPEPELVSIANSTEMYTRHLTLPFGIEPKVDEE